MSWNVSKMIEEGGLEFSVNGNKKVSVPGLSKNAVASYIYSIDKVLAFDLTEDDKKIVNSYKS